MGRTAEYFSNSTIKVLLVLNRTRKIEKQIFLAKTGFPGGFSRISPRKSTDSGLSALCGRIIVFEGTEIKYIIGIEQQLKYM